MNRQYLFAAALTAATLAAAGPALAAAYMKYEGVDGRMVSAPVESASLDAPPAMRGCSGVLGPGTATLHMGNIRNPDLVKAAASRIPFPKATLSARKSGAGSSATLEIELEDILISSLTAGDYRLSYRAGTWRDPACMSR